ncbi:MAG: SGNH/GDSL hydrolase family protein [Bacteroidota bacterium]|nr:SGNH/GDSL hydrolase family protein [Bacteroidota bacterium]
MKKFLCFSILFLSLISCAKKNDNTIIHAENPVAPVDTIHTSYLALGDSYTIGQSVPESDRFPLQTAQLLKQQNINITNPDIIAVTGWTTGDLLNALNTTPPAKNYSMVTLLIGVNNQYQGRSLDEYKTEFTDLLNRSISYAANNKNHVFVLSIPDYSVTPFARGGDTAKIAKEIDDFNAANKAITLTAGVHYIDITPVSREAKYDPSLIAGDGLHPSGAQYKKWSELIAPVIFKEIK